MTFEEVYKILYKKHKVARWDDVDKKIKVRDVTTISTWELFALIDGLKETYTPKIKMTFEQKNELMQFLGESDFGFENFWICLGSGANLYNEFTENDLMRAWLHPELIEVVDE